MERDDFKNEAERHGYTRVNLHTDSDFYHHSKGHALVVHHDNGIMGGGRFTISLHNHKGFDSVRTGRGLDEFKSHLERIHGKK